MKIVIQDYEKFVEKAHEKQTTTRELGKQIIEEWLAKQTIEKKKSNKKGKKSN